MVSLRLLIVTESTADRLLIVKLKVTSAPGSSTLVGLAVLMISMAEGTSLTVTVSLSESEEVLPSLSTTVTDALLR